MPGGPTDKRAEPRPGPIPSPWPPNKRRGRAPAAPTLFGQRTSVRGREFRGRRWGRSPEVSNARWASKGGDET
eukprot:6024270-Alexandrium_andersonii.AAC.1